MSIQYKSGYKYQLFKTTKINTAIHPAEDAELEFIQLTPEGWMIILAGYAWDGPSGPTIDTPNFMRGSLAHDAVYQLMRQGKLTGPTNYRLQADKMLRKLCLEDGMSRLRAWWVYRGVRIGAGASAKAANQKKILTAP